MMSNVTKWSVLQFGMNKYRLEIKHEALHGFRNRGKAEVSKP